MTTEEMRLALLWHFRWRLQYPIVVTECLIGDSLADIIAIRKIITEVEIKRKMPEIRRDLKEKWRKHQSYLRPSKEKTIHSFDSRPNKFYFAIPSKKFPDSEEVRAWEISTIPKPYGLILVDDDRYKPHGCRIIKRAKYLTRENNYVESFREIVAKRLTAENIDLREKLLEKNG